MWLKLYCYFDLAYTVSCTKLANGVCALKIKSVPAAERLFIGKTQRIKDGGNLPQSESFGACWHRVVEQCGRSGCPHQSSPYSSAIFQEMNHFGPQGAASEHNRAGLKWDLHTALSPLGPRLVLADLESIFTQKGAFIAYRQLGKKPVLLWREHSMEESETNSSKFLLMCCFFCSCSFLIR